MKAIIYALTIAFLGIFAYMFVAPLFSATTLKLPTQTAYTYQNFSFFSATTTSATSTTLTDGGGYFQIAGAKHVTFYMSRGGSTGANTGRSRFEVEVTPDGTNWYDYNKLIQNDAAQTGTTTVTISAATSTTITTMDVLKDTFYAVRCIVVETTDGDHTCTATADF